MARRVNKKFVVALSLGMVGVVGVAGSVIAGPKLLRMYRDRNPEVILARADAQEKAGDLKAAADSYQRAADKMAQGHIPGADVWYQRAADLCEKISDKATTANEAVSYYQLSRGLRNAALRENPFNKKLTEQLMDEMYELTAQYQFGDTKELKRLAEQMNKLEPSAKAMAYLAKIQFVQAAQSDTPSLETLNEIESKYLDEADKLQPNLALAVAVRAEIDWGRARLDLIKTSVNPRVPPKPDATEDAKNKWKETVEKYHSEKGVDGVESRLRNYLSNVEKNADVADVLANILQEKYAESRGKDKGPLTDLLSMYKGVYDAYAAKTDEASKKQRKEIAAKYANLCLIAKQSDKGVDVLQQLIKDDPDAPDGYKLLADFYRSMGNAEEAIKQYEAVRSHPQIGSGPQADINRQIQLQALENLAWLNLDVAQQVGPATVEGKARMKAAGDFTDVMRKENVIKGILLMLDGRAQLLNGDVPQAVKTLHAAEAGLNQPGLQMRLRNVDLLLAEANAREQLGQALDYVEKALRIRGDIGTAFRRAQLLMQVGRVEDARFTLEKLRGDEILVDGKSSGHYENEEALGEAFFNDVQTLYLRVSAGTRDVGSSVAGAMMRERGASTTLVLAQLELNDGDYQTAARDAESVLATASKATDTERQQAYSIAIAAYAQLGQKENKEAAKRLADEAVTKFPDKPGFKQAALQLSHEGDLSDPQVQTAIINAIEDLYYRQLAFARYYYQQKEFDKSLSAMGEAAKTLDAKPDRDRQQEVIERSFNLAVAAAASTDDAKKSDYYDMAQGYAVQAEKLNLDGTGGRFYQGRLLMAKTGNKDGLPLLVQAVSMRPDYALGRIYLGQAYIRQQNFAAALDEFREAVKLAPNNMTALYNTIELLMIRGDASSFEEARGLVRTGLNLSPYNRAFAVYQDELFKDNLRPAIEQRLAILKRDPDDLDNIMRLASLYARTEDQNQLVKAIQMMEEAHKLHGKDLNVADKLANLYLEIKTQDYALVHQQSLALYAPFLADPDPLMQFRAYLVQGDFAHKAGLQGDETYRAKMQNAAVDSYNEAIKREPKETDIAERHLGDMYFELNRFADAAGVYEKILNKSTAPASKTAVVRRLIESQLREGSDTLTKAANDRLDKLIAEDSKDAQARVLRAFGAWQKQKYDLALQELNTVLGANPNNTEALYYRGMVYAAQNKFDDAVRDLVTARSVKPDALNVRMQLAGIYLQTQRYGEAALEFTEAIKSNPDMPTIRIQYAEFLLDLFKMEKNLPAEGGIEFVDNIRRMRLKDRLVDHITESRSKFPADYWTLKYAQMLMIDGDARLALSYYQRIFERDANYKGDLSIQQLYLTCLLTNSSWAETVDRATELFNIPAVQEFLNTHPENASLYVKRAKAFYQLKRDTEGARDVDRAFALSMNYARQKQDYSVYLNVLSELTDTREPAPIKSDVVSEILRQRMAADPSETIARIAYVQNLLEANRPADADAAMKDLATPAADSVLLPKVLRLRAVVNMQNKRYEAAAEEFKTIIKDSPEDVQSLNNYAFMLAENLNNPTEAIKLAQQAVNILMTKSNAANVFKLMPSVQDTLGYAQYRKGNREDLDKAISTLEAAAKLQPVPSIYLHLAMAYDKRGATGDPAQALRFAKDGVKLATAARDPILPELQTIYTRVSKGVAEK